MWCLQSCHSNITGAKARINNLMKNRNLLTFLFKFNRALETDVLLQILVKKNNTGKIEVNKQVANLPHNLIIDKVHKNSTMQQT